jgi:hypothetical protein
MTWGALNGAWVPQTTRDAVVHFIRHWATRTGLSVVLLVGWLGIALSKFSRRSQQLGTPNQHNGRIPRDFRLEEEEKAKILAFHDLYPLEGYRRLASMMLDRSRRGDLGGAAPETGAGRRPSARQGQGEGIRSLLGHGRLSYNEGAWVEDRATRGRDPSADPGAKTGAGGTMPPHGLPGLAQKR